MDELLSPLWFHGAAALVTAVSGYMIGRRRTATTAQTSVATAEHREREQLFQHYNELVQTNREMNHSLRNENHSLRTEITVLRDELAEAHATHAEERQACQVENTRLTSELKHLKADLTDARRQLAAKDDDNG